MCTLPCVRAAQCSPTRPRACAQAPACTPRFPDLACGRSTPPPPPLTTPLQSRHLVCLCLRFSPPDLRIRCARAQRGAGVPSLGMGRWRLLTLL